MSNAIDQRPAFAPQHVRSANDPPTPYGRSTRRIFRPAELVWAIFAIATVELVCIAAVAFGVAIAYELAAKVPLYMVRYMAESIFVGCAQIGISAVRGQFRHLYKQCRFSFVSSGIGSVIATFLLLTSLLFICKISDAYSRGVLILQFFSTVAVVLAVRLGTYSRFQSAAAQGLIRGERIALIGRPDHCTRYIEQLRLSNCGAHVSVFHVTPKTTIDKPSVSSIVDRCRLLHADSIIMLIDDRQSDEETFSVMAKFFRELPADVYVVPVRGAQFWAPARPAEIGGVTALALSRRPLSIVHRTIKRTFDIVASTCGLVVLAPMFLMASIAVVLDSRGPIFYRQVRHGYNNRPIGVLKFRTMHVGDGEFRQASKGDPRITRVGRLLRFTGIDELPQLWNILRGEMSVVGPRPHAIQHNELFTPLIESFDRRHTVKPGLTGWAQVNGFRGETDTLEKMQKRIEHDFYYIDNWSLLFDFQIIALTVFSGKTYLNAR